VIPLRELILEISLDILCLTETWLTDASTAKIAALVPDTHCFYHVPRPSGLGGGVGVVLSKNLRFVNIIKHAEFVSFEFVEFTFSCFSRKFRLIIIYRPPTKSRHLFVEEFND
jgi:exonuclease III